MPKVRMRDTTSLGSGPLLAGEVYDLTDEQVAHLTSVGLAKKANADTETYAEKQAAQQGPAANEESAPMNPDIARQVAEAGTREGDRSGGGTAQREPLNRPATADEARGQTQRAAGNPRDR